MIPTVTARELREALEKLRKEQEMTKRYKKTPVSVDTTRGRAKIDKSKYSHIFVYQEDGADELLLNPIKNKILNLGFKVVAPYLKIECWDKDDLEDTVLRKDILKMGRMPLQSNTIYIACKVVQMAEPICNKFKRINHKSRAAIVNLPVRSMEEIRFNDVPIPVQKDIIFVAQGSTQQIGWYNRKNNILWMSDITANRNHAPKLFRYIVTEIDRINREEFVLAPVTSVYGSILRWRIRVLTTVKLFNIQITNQELKELLESKLETSVYLFINRINNLKNAITDLSNSHPALAGVSMIDFKGDKSFNISDLQNEVISASYVSSIRKNVYVKDAPELKYIHKADVRLD